MTDLASSRSDADVVELEGRRRSEEAAEAAAAAVEEHGDEPERITC